MFFIYFLYRDFFVSLKSFVIIVHWNEIIKTLSSHYNCPVGIKENSKICAIFYHISVSVDVSVAIRNVRIFHCRNFAGSDRAERELVEYQSAVSAWVSAWLKSLNWDSTSSFPEDNYHHRSALAGCQSSFPCFPCAYASDGFARAASPPHWVFEAFAVSASFPRRFPNCCQRTSASRSCY